MPQSPEVELESPCTCTLRPAYGLPCFHVKFECYEAKISLQKSDIHIHRWFKRDKDTGNTNNDDYDNVSTLDILSPEVVSATGRPRDALGGILREPNSSTRRNLSVFELVIRNEAREAKASTATIPSYKPGSAHKRASVKILSTMLGDKYIDRSEAFITLVNNIKGDDD